MTPQEISDFANVFDTPTGKRVLYKIIERCQVFSDNFLGEKPLTNAYYSGRRSVGLMLISTAQDADINILTLGDQNARTNRPGSATDRPDTEHTAQSNIG